MRQAEKYRVIDGHTPLSGAELNSRFLDIDGRLHRLELLDVSWQSIISEVQNHGLERIIDVIEPLLDQANDLVVQIQQELASVQQEWDQTIAQQWQNILDGWAGVQGTLDNMQNSLDTMSADLTAANEAITATNAAIRSAIPAAPIPLVSWQTDPDQHTVLSQDAYDNDGRGKDLLYKYVFPPGIFTAMYTQVLMLFDGYSLDIAIPYRMSSSAAGAVVWRIYYRVLHLGESYSEITNWVQWAAADDAVLSMTHTPSATANYRSGTSLAIPSSAYSAYDTIQIALTREGYLAADTHPGYAEVDDSIILMPVIW